MTVLIYPTETVQEALDYHYAVLGVATDEEAPEIRRNITNLIKMLQKEMKEGAEDE